MRLAKVYDAFTSRGEGGGRWMAVWGLGGVGQVVLFSLVTLVAMTAFNHGHMRGTAMMTSAVFCTRGVGGMTDTSRTDCCELLVAANTNVGGGSIFRSFCVGNGLHTRNNCDFVSLNGSHGAVFGNRIAAFCGGNGRG